MAVTPDGIEWAFTICHSLISSLKYCCSGSPGYKGLKAVVQSETNPGEDQVIYTGNAGRGKGMLAQMTQEYIVYNKIKLGYKQRQPNRQGYFKNLPV